MLQKKNSQVAKKKSRQTLGAGASSNSTSGSGGSIPQSQPQLRGGGGGGERGEGEECRISDQEAVRCALSIPEEFVPTPHKEFIKDLEVQQESSSKKQRPMLSPMKPSSLQNGKGGSEEYGRIGGGGGGGGGVSGVGGQGGGGGGPGKTLLVRDRERKLRSAFAKYKKWDEAERCTVERLDGNRIMIDDDIILNVNHTDYIKESDVVLELDVDYRTCSMPPSPCPVALPVGDGNCCQAPSCRLGCICESINREPVVRTHCGKPRCFFDCNCSQSLFSNGDDGDIRSRLRPRVSLLNWRFMESAERDKDPPPVNYRQLERGIQIYPRMRRVPVAPQRFRNEYIMSTKFKDTLNRERRKPVGITKFIRKPPTPGVKRDAQGSIYRRNYLVKSSVKPKEISPVKVPNIRPCSVSIDALQPVSNEDEDEDEENPPEPPEQEPLHIPNVVQVIQRDGIIVLMGDEELCFVTFSTTCKHPQAVVYMESKDREFICPWLYLPFTSSQESWIFHPIHLSDDETTFTCIPEIDCVIPTKALRMHMNRSRTKKKTVALKMLWVGPDSKKRHGSIYLLPALPNVIICGPFPHDLMKPRFSKGFHHLERVLRVCSYVEELSSGRFAGDVESWNTFFTKNKEQINATLQANLKKDVDTGVTTHGHQIPLAAYDISPMESPSESDQDQDQEPSSPETEMEAAGNPTKSDKLCVSWNDAAKLLSVQP